LHPKGKQASTPQQQAASGEKLPPAQGTLGIWHRSASALSAFPAFSSFSTGLSGSRRLTRLAEFLLLVPVWAFAPVVLLVARHSSTCNRHGAQKQGNALAFHGV